MGYGSIAAGCRRCAWSLSGILLLALGAQAAVAAAVPIYPTTANITSTADRMISYRNQQHSWQTSDGAVHIMVNLGSQPTGDSLALYSSFDGGVTWNQMFTLAGTDEFSTSDGTLATIGTTANLLLVYGTAQATGTILYASASYNPAAQTWTLGTPQTVFADSTMAGSNPAFGSDAAGNFWCGFTAQDLTTLQYQEDLVYRAPKSTQWTNTGLVFGSGSNLQHSARPVPYKNGMAMIYESGTTMYWAYRLNTWPLTQAWTTSVMFTGLPPYSQDPYGTHYSVVADAANNLHLTLIANQQLLYMRYLTSTGKWGPVRALTTTAINAAYSQATIAGSNVMLFVNNQQSIEVLQSTDNGNTFTITQSLLHTTPPPGSSLYYGNPRIETPSYATSPVPAWQQFVNGPIQGLLFFEVPVIK